MSNLIKFSVVTVCLNAEKTIEKTIKSVLAQTECDMEYIIMDGKSQDNTLTLAYKYISDDRMTIYSQTDKGLYSAMNNSINYCNGHYIIFMNSGDVFYNAEVLKKVSEIMVKNEQRADIYYGDVIRTHTEGKVKETYNGHMTLMKLLLIGKMPCHQSIFTQIDIMRRYPFDEKFSITADYNFIMKCTKEKCTFEHINAIIANVDCIEGISSQKENVIEMRKQDDQSLKELYPIWFWIILLPKALYRIIVDRRGK